MNDDNECCYTADAVEYYQPVWLAKFAAIRHSRCGSRGD